MTTPIDSVRAMTRQQQIAFFQSYTRLLRQHPDNAGLTGRPKTGDPDSYWSLQQATEYLSAIMDGEPLESEHYRWSIFADALTGYHGASDWARKALDSLTT